MMSNGFFVSILLFSLTCVTSAQELSCHLHQDNFHDGTVSITYDREELSVYKYNNTKFVNFLLRDVQVKFSGKFTNEKEVKFDIAGLQSDVEGAGKLKKNEKEPSLTTCHFDLKKNTKFVDNVDLPIQVRIMALAHACIKPKLCQSLGSIQQDDYIRAKIDRHDFGENSVMYDAFAEKYPNLNLPSATENNLQHAINLLADFGLASLFTQMSKKKLGLIVLPNVDETIPGVSFINQGHFRLSDGKFGYLRNFTRSKDVMVTHKGLEFSLQAEYRIPKANIRFNKYALKYGLLSSNGKVDIKINEVTFSIKVTINYNKSPCQIAASAVKSEIGDITFKLSNNGVFDSVINKITTDIVNRYIPNILSLVETKIKNAIEEPLEKLDCEKYRP